MFTSPVSRIILLFLIIEKSYQFYNKIVYKSVTKLYDIVNYNNDKYINNEIINELLKVGNINYNNNDDELNYESIFLTFATNNLFLNEYWQKKPFLCNKNVNYIINTFTMNDVKHSTETDFLEAGRGTFVEGNTGWNMATVSKPKGTSYNDARLKYDEIEVAMKEKSGTIVFNSAGAFIRKLSKVCLDGVNAFQYPVAMNTYLTNIGQITSAPPHTDKQDVFVIQTQGFKRWRVYNPPEVSNKLIADPFARGKGKDILDLKELESKPLIDVVLSPGNILYIPAGYPHTTDTVNGIDKNINTPSVHMTVGIDTHIWGLNYGNIRKIILSKADYDDNYTQLTKLSNSDYFLLHEAIPMGFLSERIISKYKSGNNNLDDDKIIIEMRKDVVNEIKKNVLLKMNKIEPLLNYDEDEINKKLKYNYDNGINDINSSNLDLIILNMMDHHQQITDIFGQMYADVFFKITPVKIDLSFFRSRPYFEKLEETMNKFDQWCNQPLKTLTVKEKDNKKQTASNTVQGFGKKNSIIAASYYLNYRTYSLSIYIKFRVCVCYFLFSF